MIIQNIRASETQDNSHLYYNKNIILNRHFNINM